MEKPIAVRWHGTLFHLLCDDGKTACGLEVPKGHLCYDWPLPNEGHQCYRCSRTVAASKVRKVYLASPQPTE